MATNAIWATQGELGTVFAATQDPSPRCGTSHAFSINLTTQEKILGLLRVAAAPHRDPNRRCATSIRSSAARPSTAGPPATGRKTRLAAWTDSSAAADQKIISLPATAIALATDSLIFLTCQLTSTKFLADSGVTLSILPHKSSQPQSGRRLHAINGSVVIAWGFKTVRIQLGGSTFAFQFLLANVKHAILGFTFLNILAWSNPHPQV